ncbi:hypothetical protein HWV62_18510 [Athelia sp. TMB]|nr:hypothetical protein HWV62_18510 [Athelia sp. TMB]
MAFAKAQNLDVSKGTFNDIQGSQNIYYINNFFTDPQWDDSRSHKEGDRLKTPDPYSRDSLCEEPESSPQSASDNKRNRPRAFRKEYQRPSLSFRWYREVPTVIRCLAFSPDGQIVAAGTRDGSIVTWAIPEGRKDLIPQKVHRDSIRAIAFYPDGSRLVTGSRDTTLSILCAVSGSVLFGPLRGHSQCITSIAVSPDGNYIFSGDKGGDLRCWCARTGFVLPFRHRSSSPINSIAFSNDSKWLVCGAARLLFFEYQAGAWHFADYPKESFRDAKVVSSVAVTPDNRVVICAAGTRVQMWHAEKGKQVAREFEMASKVHSIAASPDGRHFVSGSAYGDLTVCDMRERKRVATTRIINASIMTTPSNIDCYAVAFSPDGRFIVGGGAWGLNLYSCRLD